MLYARINNGAVVQYPYSLIQLRQDFPNTSFAIPHLSADLAEFGVVEVLQTEKPDHSVLTHTISEAPPELRGGRWVQCWVADPRPLADARAQLKADAAAQRWAVETAGITLPNGVRVKTGQDDQARITSVISNAKFANITTVDFKAASGWVSMTVTDVEAIAAYIALHVRACFAAERAHDAAIDALQDLQGAQAYDVTAGWPDDTGGA